MKKLSVLAIVCSLLLGLGVIPVSAAGGGAHIFVDGSPLQSKSILKNGVSFVPFRELFEKLGMEVSYNAKLKQVTGKKAELKMTFTIGSKSVDINGKKKTLQAAPFTQNGSTYIPVRVVGEETGNKVYWSSEANLIQINSPSFKGASYTIDGVSLYISANGSIEIGPAADKAFENQRELAEIAAYKEFIANSPVIRVIGVPPTEEESKLPGYKGYPNHFDINYVNALKNDEKLPPLMSDGWISLAMLTEIEGVNYLGKIEPDTIRIGKYVGVALVDYKIEQTAEYKKAKDGDFVLSNLNVKKHKNTMYLNIEELKEIGLIESDKESSD